MLLRLLAGLCFLSLVFSDLTRAVHLLLERHVVCAHGELVEAHESAGTRASPAGAEGDRVSPEPASLEEHRHCTSAMTPSRPLSAATVRADIVTLPAPSIALVWFGAGPAPTARCVLAFAPKQGPPV